MLKRLSRVLHDLFNSRGEMRYLTLHKPLSEGRVKRGGNNQVPTTPKPNRVPPACPRDLQR